MPDALDELKQFARQTIDELLKELPAEERLKGLSADELLTALSPETRKALAQRLKDDGSPPHTEAGESGHDEPKQ